MQKTIDRSTNEIKCSIGVDVATQDACSTISNGKLSKTLRLRKIKFPMIPWQGYQKFVAKVRDLYWVFE